MASPGSWNSDFMGRRTISMLNTIPISIAVGTILGFLAALGVGGGSLLILWLTLILDTPQDQARIINLMFFLPAALIACCFRLKQRKLNLKAVLPAIFAGCVFAALFSQLADILDDSIARKLFGILLLFTGARELTYRARKRK